MVDGPDYVVIVSPQARGDVADIGDHIAAEAGYETAFDYVARLTRAMLSLSRMPHRTQRYAHAQRGVHRLVNASHSVFYLVVGTGVRILRVLHQSQDPARHVQD